MLLLKFVFITSCKDHNLVVLNSMLSILRPLFCTATAKIPDLIEHLIHVLTVLCLNLQETSQDVFVDFVGVLADIIEMVCSLVYN